MGKSLKYGEHEFPESFGFKGSAGKTMVKGYERNPPVRVAASDADNARSLANIRRMMGSKPNSSAAQTSPPPKAKPVSDKPTSLDGVLKGRNPFHNKARQEALDGYAKGGSVCAPCGAKKMAQGGLAGKIIDRVRSKAVPVAPSKPLIQPPAQAPGRGGILGAALARGRAKPAPQAAQAAAPQRGGLLGRALARSHAHAPGQRKKV